MGDTTQKETMITSRAKLPQIDEVTTSLFQSTDIKEFFEEIMDSLLLHLAEKARDELETKVKERTLELMEANRKLRELSITDGLTGLFNHRYFMRALEAEYKRAIRYKRSLALLLLDIDHFKNVNDTYGHPCGDLVLKGVAALLRSCLRSADVAARYGGDEIAVILPETSKSKASEVAEKLRRQVEKSSFEWEGNSFSLTCSIGVAAVPEGNIDCWNELLYSADKSLYRAKGKGRNHVIAFNPRQGRAVSRGARSPRRRVLAVH